MLFKKNKYLNTTFYLLIAAFVLIILEMAVPQVRELLSGSEIFLIPFVLFSGLGVALTVLTLRAKLPKPARRYLLVTGFASAGVLIGAVLHNLFYALAIVTEHLPAVSYIAGILSAGFFIIGLLVCPIAYIVGTIGSIVKFIKTK
ncbi:MAG: hypothetical protein ABIA47_01180 [bacterium]